MEALEPLRSPWSRVGVTGVVVESLKPWWSQGAVVSGVVSGAVVESLEHGWSHWIRVRVAVREAPEPWWSHWIPAGITGSLLESIEPWWSH